MSPSDRKMTRPTPLHWLGRQLMVSAATIAALRLCAWWLDGVDIDGHVASWAAAVVIGVLDAVVWPVVLRYAIRLVVLTVGIAVVAMNAALIGVASWIVSGFSVDSMFDAVVVALVVATVSGIMGSLVGFDDPARQRARVVRALGGRTRIEPTDVPGVLFIQIDGLAHDVLLEAIASGQAPAMAEMMHSGTHRLIGWECDLSSQTGAMQAGIMFGDNSNMPAFRWYHKERRRVVASNNPTDASEIEATRNRDSDLLTGGVSRGNVFSGGAADSLYTFATLRTKRPSDTGLIPIFASPGSVIRIVGMGVADMIREVRAARRARRVGERPLGDRGGIYPLLRAGVNIGLTEITLATLIGDIHGGVPSAYANFVGYDEVAHHSGPSRPDALDSLRRVDDRIALLMDGFEQAPRPYEIVILSDHGQSQGSTFLQRFDITLNQLITSLTDRRISEPATVTEGWGNVNGILSDAVRGDSLSARIVCRLLSDRIATNGLDVKTVEVGPDHHQERPDDEGIVVLASGNLGLVSFTDIDGRADLAGIETRYPGLVSGLVDHPGVGFVMVRSELDRCGVVISRNGVHHLTDHRVEGMDPLAGLGANAAAHLARTDTFDNCPDLVVNSFYDPDTDEGAAFEELIGFHGGLGGRQSAPFILAPGRFPLPDQPVVGAEAVHHLFTSWMRQIG